MSASLDILRKSLAANGLPTSGTKAEMLQRLLSGTKDKRKKAKGTTSVPDTVPNANIVGGENTSADYLRYAAHERTQLIATGITDDAVINAEINRRWSVVQAATTSPSAPKTTITLPIMLDADALAQADLTFITQIDTNKYMYARNMTPSKPNEIATSPTKGDSLASMTRTDVKKDNSNVDAVSDAVEANAVSGSKRKANSESAVIESKTEKEEEDEMAWPCEVTSMRLMKKLKTKPDIMKTMLQCFGVPTTGTPKELADRLAEQMHYETDDD